MTGMLTELVAVIKEGALDLNCPHGIVYCRVFICS